MFIKNTKLIKLKLGIFENKSIYKTVKTLIKF